MIFDIVKVTIFVGISLRVSALHCERGWFGSRCQFMCHCKWSTPCDGRGECAYGCDDGYFGDKCQYVEYDKPQNIKPYIDNGNCSRKHNTYDMTYFTWTRLVFKDFIPAYMSIFFQDKTRSYIECKNYYIMFVNAKTVDYFCVPFVILRTGYIHTNFGTADICRMYLSRGRNLALKQPSSDPITVDGDRDSETNCFLSTSWNVSFAYPSSINNIVIYTTQVTETPNFAVYYKVAQDSDWVEYVTSSFYKHGSVFVSDSLLSQPPATGVKVYILDDETINFCEVEVIGDFMCPSYRYGVECQINCTCRTENQDCEIAEQCGFVCDPKDVGCKSDFVTRYKSLPYISPEYMEECENGTYGFNCEQTCSRNCSTCNGATSRCLTCPAGMQGEFCEQVCDVYTYGLGCQLPCSTQCTDRLCDNVDGTCIGCPEGQYGAFCEHECENHYYGVQCNSVCSQDCVDQLCRKIDGVCLSCPPGREGEFCDKECDVHYFGQNCVSRCSINCKDQLCNITDGICLICPPGHFGDFCDKEDDTNQTKCRVDCGSNDCDPITDRCICLPGRIGYFCEYECSNTTFGFNCVRQCNKDCLYQSLNSTRLCNPVTGDCVLKASGSTSEVADTEDQSALAMYFLFALPLIIIAIIVIIIFLLRKLKQAQTEPEIVPVEKTLTSTSVPIPQLKTYILGNSKEFFLNQFKSIPTVYIGENTEKKNLAAIYDHSFISLTPWPPKKPGDFHSPSFLALSKEKLIATQGPVAATVVSFLNLLWDKHVVKVAMINTETKNDEDSYWSKNDKKIDCYTVKTAKTEVFTDYTLRTLDIIKDNHPPRQLTHFQYTAWPVDGSDPCLWSLVEFEHRVFFNTMEEVTLVHCGRSANRSSLFIALHDLIRQAKLNNSVDFVETVSRLRQDRPNMISTFEQYMFLHHAAQAGIACTGSYTHISAIFLKVHLMGNVVNGKSNFENEFKNLFSVEIKFTDGDGAITQDPKSKDRFNILPDKKYQPVLQTDSTKETAYINAVTVPSMPTQPKQFLTQLPMPTTVNDFWRLVTQNNVSLIVAFKSYEKDKSLANYLPQQKNQTLQCGNIAINIESTSSTPTWEEMKLTVKDKQSSTVTHLKFTETDLELKYIIPYVQRARTLRATDEAVVYTCRNGAERSGFAYVLTTLIDRLDQDDYMTVPVVVGKVKSIRPQVIPTLQQYIALYEALKLYTEGVISKARYRDEYSSTV